MKWTVAALVILATASPARAAIIDFDDLGVGTGGNVLADQFESRGYVFSASEHLHVINDLAPTTSWNGTAWLGVHNDGADANRVVMTRATGGYFDLLSLDIGEWFGYPNGVVVQITGDRDTGSVTRTLAVDGLAQADGAGPLDDFGTVAFDDDWKGLWRVTFEAIAGNGARWYALDDVVTTDVPEPTAWSLLLVGAGMSVGRRLARRRRSSTAHAL